jgi:hypothetical protein
VIAETIAAFVAGFVGSVHCLGMCGGIAAALGASSSQQGRNWLPLAHNLGRIASYTLAGAIVGAASAWIGTITGLKAWGPSLRILVGVLFLLIGLQLAFQFRGLAVIESGGARVWQKIAPLARRLMPARTAPSAFAVGMLWGWLPCGLVYSLLAVAAATGDPVRGAAVMASFGLGTTASMLGVAWLAAGTSWTAHRARLRRPAGVLLMLFGVWTVVGVGLPMHGGGHAPAGDADHTMHSHH